jgi:MFS family permease
MTSPLGHDYRQLWLAATISRAGDGVFLTALPLLSVSVTRNPLAISAVQFSLTLPWLLFALISGALAGRWDRRTIMWCTDLCRFVVTAALALTILAGALSIPLLAAFGFVLGTCETLFDSAALSILPTLVGTDPEQLTRANARLDAAGGIANGFIGPAGGAGLYTLAQSAPAVANAASFLSSAALLRLIPKQPPSGRAPRDSLLTDIRDGIRWLFGHSQLTALAVAVGMINLSTNASTTLLVLYLREAVGAGTITYTLILICAAVGGLVGNLTAERHPTPLQHRRAMPLAVAGIAISLATIGAIPNTAVIAASFALIGLAGATWNVTTISLRQRLIPPELLGRINSVYRLIAYGTIPLGALAGGAIANNYGSHAPFLIGGALLAVTAVTLNIQQVAQHC